MSSAAAQVIPFRTPAMAPEAPSASENPEVAAAYGVLAKVKNYRHRPEQQQLSEETAAAILANIPLVSEAPTGSGKTIGYSIGALAACAKLGLPLVISTATVSLQKQVMDSDLRKVELTGLIKRGEYKLVKGRGRFFCPLSAEALLGGGEDSFQKDLFGEKAETSAEDRFDAQRLAEQLLPAFEAGWTGTIDELPEGVAAPSAKVWACVSSNSDACLRQNCERYAECPFFKERAAWSEARVLVANHSLVMMDLLSTAEGREPVFPFRDYVLAVDEAHHLPERALEAAKVDFRPGSLLEQLDELERVLRDTAKNRETMRPMQDRIQGNPGDEVRQLRAATHTMLDAFTSLGFTQDAFSREAMITPDDATVASIHEAVGACIQRLTVLTEQVNQAVQLVSSIIRKACCGGGSPLHIMHSALAAGLGRLRTQLNGVQGFFGAEVKWVSSRYCAARPEKWEPVLNGSPLEGRELLNKLLWEQGRARVVMVSATLRGTSGFDHFLHEVALREREHRTQILPARFNYHSAPMYRSPMKALPGSPEFVPELLSWLERLITPGAGPELDMGTLVLFTNRRTMREAYARLKKVFGDVVIAQDHDGSAAALRAIHCARIDEGRPTVLLGLKSLAEGFDLPGKYCTHVLITQVPFESPSDPVQLARERTYGRAYFSEHVLPAVSRELCQMVGRLLRREDDWGRITILDKRLWARRYGRSLLQSLPPFPERDLPRRAPEASNVLELARF